MYCCWGPGMPPQVTLAPQLRIYTFTSLMSTHRHPEHRLQIYEKSEWFLMTAAPPSSGALQKRLPPCRTAKKKRLEVPTILPEPPRPKDAKSIEKPGRRVILAALEFFHISWFLNPIFFYGQNKQNAIAIMPHCAVHATRQP